MANIPDSFTKTLNNFNFKISKTSIELSILAVSTLTNQEYSRVIQKSYPRDHNFRSVFHDLDRIYFLLMDAFNGEENHEINFGENMILMYTYRNSNNECTGFEIPLIGGSIKDNYDSMNKMILDMNQTIDILKSSGSNLGVQIEKKFEEICSVFETRQKKLEDLVNSQNQKITILTDKIKNIEGYNNIVSENFKSIEIKLKALEEKQNAQFVNLESKNLIASSTNETKIKIFEDLVKSLFEKNNQIITEFDSLRQNMDKSNKDQIQENKAIHTKISSIEELVFDSSLINKDFLLAKSYYQFMKEATGKNKFTLIYRGTRDGMTANAFHQICDNKGATITVMKNNLGKIFGGYSPESWTSRGNYINNTASWIFSLTANSKYTHNGSYYNYAVYDHSNYGPSFGGGHDIYISANFKSTNGNSSHKHTYNIPNNYELTGSSHFCLIEIEVYTLS